MKLTDEMIEQAKDAVRRHYEEGVTYAAIAAEIGIHASTLQGRITNHARDIVNEYRNKARRENIQKDYIEKKEASKWMDKAYKLGIEQMSAKVYELHRWIEDLVEKDIKRGNKEGARRLKKVLNRMKEMKL